MEFQGLKKPNSNVWPVETRVSPLSSLRVWPGAKVSNVLENEIVVKQKKMDRRNFMGYPISARITQIH